MARIGLVLGAGGITGHAFHAGVLDALERELGWDARAAEVIVGTSAGSGIGAMLRAGVRGRDFASRIDGSPASPEGRAVFARLASAMPSSPPRIELRAPRGRPASPALALRMALRPWDIRLGTLAAAVLPAGTLPFPGLAGALFRGPWPRESLWVCAVRLDTGARVVFGRGDASTVDVGDAVAASCAIPGLFEPVDIGGVRYVDGGAHSPTNLDLLAGLGLDLVIVSSPMSAPRAARRGAVDAPLRAMWHTRLGVEKAGVRRRGTDVVVFEPGASELEVMGVNALDPSRRDAVLERTRRAARERIAGNRLLLARVRS